MQTLMSKEPAENYAILKDTCWRLYPSIKVLLPCIPSYIGIVWDPSQP